MKKGKNKFRKLLLSVFFVGIAVFLSACGRTSADGVNVDEQNGQKKLQVVATIFPEYDWVREILGEQADNVELTLLLANGVDMHSFQPTMSDILKVSTCDVFIYVGGESDAWVADALKGAGNPDRTAINLMEVLGDRAKEEEVVEGMQEEDGHDGHDHEEQEELEYDEHVWLSLKNTQVFCDAISEALQAADPENAKLYQENTTAYKEKLAALDREYQAAVDQSESKTLLFADRFPFRYLTDDYNLTYYAAFTGCSAETDASFETITFLAGKLDELKLPVVFVIENSDGKVAKAVVENTNTRDQKILTLNSMQSVTSDEINAGTTYLSIMKENLKTLKEAL
ncbi:MAG: metal ABC transporter substrate-binding protein [Blautia sp.]